ncbi:MAG TPA: transaldolase family protein, partial [Nevskiaceae bacterium]|nr:transaldolase family protein [Nevskiaceae bacterium]
MNAPTAELRALGQSLWLDSISRQLLDAGTLARYIGEFGVSGVTSNPAIFHKAIACGGDYDEELQRLWQQGRRGEDLVFDLAIGDIRGAADLLAPVHRASAGA